MQAPPPLLGDSLWSPPSPVGLPSQHLGWGLLPLASYAIPSPVSRPGLSRNLMVQCPYVLYILQYQHTQF